MKGTVTCCMYTYTLHTYCMFGIGTPVLLLILIVCLSKKNVVKKTYSLILLEEGVKYEFISTQISLK